MKALSSLLAYFSLSLSLCECEKRFHFSAVVGREIDNANFLIRFLQTQT